MSERPKCKWVSWETWYAYWQSRLNTNRYGCTSLGKYNIWNPEEKQYWAVHPESVPPDLDKLQVEHADRTRCFMATDLYGMSCDHEPSCKEWFRTEQD